MAHPQNPNDTPELRLRCLTEFPPPDGTHPSKESNDTNNSGSESEFSASSDQFRTVAEALRQVRPEGGWSGESGSSYVHQNTNFGSLLTQIAQASQEVDATVQNEGEQVKAGRDSLINVLGGLQAAIPLAQSLYFSGPAGPALSYGYQLAVANSAIGTSIETTNSMHQNAQQNGERLTALAQQYTEAAHHISSATPVAAVQTKSPYEQSCTSTPTVSLVEAVNHRTASAQQRTETTIWANARGR